jgi:hypothetical protein
MQIILRGGERQNSGLYSNLREENVSESEEVEEAHK